MVNRKPLKDYQTTEYRPWKWWKQGWWNPICWLICNGKIPICKTQAHWKTQAHASSTTDVSPCKIIWQSLPTNDLSIALFAWRIEPTWQYRWEVFCTAMGSVLLLCSLKGRRLSSSGHSWRAEMRSEHGRIEVHLGLCHQLYPDWLSCNSPREYKSLKKWGFVLTKYYKILSNVNLRQDSASLHHCPPSTEKWAVGVTYMHSYSTLDNK